MIGLEIVGALAGIVAALQGWRSLGHQKRALKTEAVRALSEAVTATQEVVDKRSQGVPDGIDYKLTNLWHRASLAFREAEEDKLARLCQIKGNYWLDPSQWTRELIRDAGIQLTGMQRELQRLLANKDLLERKGT
jgi:hypothetical protein